MLTDDQRRILEVLADPTSDVRGLIRREREAIRAALDTIDEQGRKLRPPENFRCIRLDDTSRANKVPF